MILHKSLIVKILIPIKSNTKGHYKNMLLKEIVITFIISKNHRTAMVINKIPQKRFLYFMVLVLF